MPKGPTSTGAASMATPSAVSSAITTAVQRLYEAYPYPRYPLVAKPRWQEGYLASSLLAARLAAARFGIVPPALDSPERRGQLEVLVGGSGEILPYVVRQWEPGRHRVTCLDLSRTSLLRARLRLFPSLAPTRFVRGDLAAFLEAAPGSYAHIDAFGVIHHLANPRSALRSLGAALAPGGTARLMLYNAPARAWIRELAHAFELIGLDRHVRDDLSQLRGLLSLLTQTLPSLAQRIGQLGAATIGNDARLVDTFLHAREARLEPSAWLAAVRDAGLEIAGVVDRYAELDDLPNPLWSPPTGAELDARAMDRRFEGNLELFVARVDGARRGAVAPTRAALPLKMRWKSPPRMWFDYEETRGIAAGMRWKLWRAHLEFVREGRKLSGARTLDGITRAAQGRLARLGAILPGMVEARLVAPLEAKMDVPRKEDVREVPVEVVQRVDEMLRARGRFTERRMGVVVARLGRSQL